jgi:hypothetical protein
MKWRNAANVLEKKCLCWRLRQLQPAADNGARKKPVEKYDSEVTYRPVVTFRLPTASPFRSLLVS